VDSLYVGDIILSLSNLKMSDNIDDFLDEVENLGHWAKLSEDAIVRKFTDLHDCFSSHVHSSEPK